MTDQPPPPGTHPPPPSSPGGAESIPTDTPIAGGTRYTPWITRVLAWLIDYIPVIVLLGIGVGYLFSSASQDITACITDNSEFELGEFCATGDQGLTGAALIILTATSLLATVYVLWNYGYRQGTTGSSIGKSLTRCKVVSEKTGEPIGFGMSVVRQVVHIVDAAICYIGYLFPLWDAKRQTIADKLMSTVCVPFDSDAR